MLAYSNHHNKQRPFAPLPPPPRFARPPVRPCGASCVHRIVRWSPGTAAPLRLSYPRYAHMLTHPRRAARLAPFLRAAWRNDRVGRLLPKWAAVLNAGLRRKHPELFDGSRDNMLEVVPKGASGLGVDVKSGVSIPKGTVLGAYGGCLGTTVSALCSSPRASGYPAPTQAPGIPPIAALASHGARLQVTSSSNLRDVGPIKLAH